MTRYRWYTITSNDGAGDDYIVRATSRGEAWKRIGGDRDVFRPFTRDGRRAANVPESRIYR